MSSATVAHKSRCGCGKEVVKSLSPTDWKLIFEGKFISLDLSIGNCSFALPVSLLDTRRQGPMGGNVVPRRNLRRKSQGPTSEKRCISRMPLLHLPSLARNRSEVLGTDSIAIRRICATPSKLGFFSLQLLGSDIFLEKRHNLELLVNLAAAEIVA